MYFWKNNNICWKYQNNLSYGRPVYASSQAGESSAAEYAVDNNTSTRWQAKQSDQNEWLYVDLGKEADIDQVYLYWEAAYAKKYQIQVSNDEDNWTTIYTKGQAKGAHVNIAFTYEVTKFADGYGELNANWTAVGEGQTEVAVTVGPEASNTEMAVSRKYYVKARVVQVIGKKKYYSGWTKPKKIRIKK